MAGNSSLEWKKRRAISFPSLVLVAIAAAFIPILFVSRSSFSSLFLDLKGPLIKTAAVFPRGIGLAPVTLKFEISDPIAGVREILVWTRQEGQVKEILRRQVPQRHVEQISVNFEGQASGLREGNVDVVVRAVDGSWFANTSEIVVPLVVDFEKPRLDVFPSDVSVLREGQSHIVFYRGQDKKLAVTGVKTGDQFFQAHPAKYIDRDLSDPSLFVCLFGVPLNGKQPQSVRLIAEDLVGNTASITLMPTVSKLNARRVERNLNEELLKDHYMRLMESVSLRIEKIRSDTNVQQAVLSTNPVLSDMLWRFKFFNETLRSQNEEEILAHLNAGPRFERYWEDYFLRPQGEIKSGFGDNVVYVFAGKDISSHMQTGYEVAVSWSERDILAGNDGFVAFTGDFGVYGKVLTIDHGLGLVSLYGNLEKVSALRGERVRKGQQVAIAGASGMFPGSSYYLEMRIDGTPVDAQGWWSSSWYKGENTQAIENVKRALGIQVLKPVEGGF